MVGSQFGKDKYTNKAAASDSLLCPMYRMHFTAKTIKQEIIWRLFLQEQ
jgi:hypothetical protein